MRNRILRRRKGEINGPNQLSFPKTALITEIAAPYRTGFLNHLGEILGDSVRVFFYGETERRRNWRLDKNLRINYEVVPGLLFQFRHGHPYFFNPCLLPAIQRFDPKVIVLGGYAHPTAPLVLMYARATRRKAILWSESTLFDDRPRTWIRETYKRWFVGLCHGFFVPGQAGREYALSLGASPGMVFGMPNATDLDPYDRAVLSARLRGEERRAILFVGRISRGKGVWDLLEAYGRLSEARRPPMWLIGDGPDRGAVEKFVHASGWVAVKVLGPLLPEELPRFYAEAGIFVFPSYGEPWGMVLNEAAASGLPIIASSTAGGTIEIVENGVSGYIIPPKDVAALASHLEQLIGDPEQRQRMGRAARRKIEHFGPLMMAKRFVRGVRSVVLRGW